MITRYAIFVGTVKDGQHAAMRAYVKTELEPLWQQFACAKQVKVSYGVEQDPKGPKIPLMLAITYDDKAGMAAALDSPARYASRDLLQGFYDQFFEDVTLHHYVMD